MKILSIGNSFSQDAQRYLRGVAEAAGESCKCMNLFIGGCTLKTHFENFFGERALYNLQLNGEVLNIYVTVKEALVSDSWDVITLQQQSLSSCDFETMRPYIKALADAVRAICPTAKLYLHQTWADETGAPRALKAGYNTMAEYFAAVKDSYFKAAELISADGIIPSGEAMLALSDAGVKAHRDTFHASYDAGRYTIALTWLETLFGADAMGNGFRGFDGELSEEQVKICQASAHSAAKKYNR